MVTEEGVRHRHIAAGIGKVPLECPALAGPKEGKLVRELEFPNRFRAGHQDSPNGEKSNSRTNELLFGVYLKADTPESHRYLDNRIA